MLSELGRREEALAASEEAVGISRAGRRPPGRVPPRPGQGAEQPGDVLAELGRREEALAAIGEAVAIYRQLAARWPDAYRHKVEQLSQVAAWLEHGEDLSDALPQEPKE